MMGKIQVQGTKLGEPRPEPKEPQSIYTQGKKSRETSKRNKTNPKLKIQESQENRMDTNRRS